MSRRAFALLAAGCQVTTPVLAGRAVAPDHESGPALIARPLLGADGRRVAAVDNLLLDPDGRLRGVVVEWGGVLGFGERRAVVPAERVVPGASGERARLATTREQLEAALAFSPARLAEIGIEAGWGEGLRGWRR